MKFKVFKSNYIFAARNENQIKEISDDVMTKRPEGESEFPNAWSMIGRRTLAYIVEQSVAS